MTKTTHTPGPWIVQSEEINPLRFNVVQSIDEGAVIAGPFFRQTSFADNDQAIANARLIAAAPELLAALEECLEVFGLPEATPDEFGTCYTASQRSATIAKATIKARAAIAKAKG